jgi:hypothetical protein
MQPPILTFPEFAAKYCERQENTPENLKLILQGQLFNNQPPDGWMLLECEQLDSSRVGSLTILAYGPNNTYKSPPSHPISPRGLASDMSVVVALLPHDNLQ